MTTIYESLAAVMKDCGAVRKLDRNTQQGFNFRGIDAVPEKILSRLRITESGCWEWAGAISRGYGRVRWDSQSRLVHRLVYTWVTGSDVGELDLDHLCRNRACANPEHLEPVTHIENIRRGEWSNGAARKQLAKTHCANGHVYTSETTYIPPASSPRQRQCRICRLAAKRQYNTRKRVIA